MKNNQTITPEQIFSAEPSVNDNSSHRPTNNNVGITSIIVVGLVMGVGGFVGGMQVGKSSSSTASLPSQLSGTEPTIGDMRGRPDMGLIGTVTSISDDSISINDIRQNKTVTFSIGSDTTITDSGSASTFSDISVGDNVLIKTDSSSSSDSSVASAIELNPTMGPSQNQHALISQ